MNTKFFHASASSRRRRNTIESLNKDDGAIVNTKEGLNVLAHDYFSSLFAGDNSEVTLVTNHVQVKLVIDDNEVLFAPFTADEFKHAILNMHFDKAAGPDSLNAAFY